MSAINSSSLHRLQIQENNMNYIRQRLRQANKGSQNGYFRIRRESELASTISLVLLSWVLRTQISQINVILIGTIVLFSLV